ncbi:hypothetical protein [Fusobacterium periodonticum]|uniref:hypothetical protein n=1 Tax=Fusobacterium periodonticum TaxID=860 RepID=UPI0028D2F10C|nr:hypothetical protein [Fusobacterium periodonticum]
MIDEAYNPIKEFEDELLSKKTKIGSWLCTDFEKDFKIQELLDSFTKEIQKNKEFKDLNYWLYEAFYSNILKKKEKNIFEKSFLYHCYLFKTLKEKIRQGNEYKKVIVDLRYAKPDDNLNDYKNEIKEIFRYFYVNSDEKNIEVEFINEKF